MKFEIKQIGNGIQHLNRLIITCDNETKKEIDIWDNELAELKEQIEQRFACENIYHEIK